jgi:hypothetical protein
MVNLSDKSLDCWIETDASLEGWGSKFNEQFAGGRWSKDEFGQIRKIS